ncbi:MAG TPA: hypothetical protein DDY31_04065 [Lachnospiraceae bacterium]|nr:hypothetical protein [Lachnospiraceae bacterium]
MSPDLLCFKEMKCEIQLRTVLQIGFTFFSYNDMFVLMEKYGITTIRQLQGYIRLTWLMLSLPKSVR